MKTSMKLPAFQSFMASPAGRLTRVILGFAIIAKGIQTGGKKGSLLTVLGFVPLAAGTFDICTLSPMLGGYLSGQATRSALHTQSGFPQLGAQAQSWFQV